MPRGDVYAVNAGGGATGGFTADQNFVLGDVYANTSQAVYTSTVPNSAPAGVYSDARQGTQFGYTFTGLSSTTTYAVIFHFAELYFSLPRQRQFNVSVNGTSVLTDFDIVRTAGGPFVAVVQSFLVPSDTSGTIAVSFSRGAVDQPMINAIEVRGDTDVVDAGSDAASAISFGTNVYPIITARCTLCHANGAVGVTRGHLDMGSAASALSNLLNVPAAGAACAGVAAPGGGPLLRVAPGDPTNSLLYNKIVSNNGSGSTVTLPVGGPEVFCGEPMPLHQGALRAADLATVHDWIQQGARP